MKTLLEKAKGVKAGNVKHNYKNISKEEIDLCMALGKKEITLTAAQEVMKFNSVNSVYVLSHHCLEYLIKNDLIDLKKLEKLK